MTTSPDKTKGILLTALLYLLAVAVGHLVGFRMEIPWGYVQLLDARIVSEHPATSLWYMHNQPPGLMVVFALVMNASRLLDASPTRPPIRCPRQLDSYPNWTASPPG